jgi:uncharacterized protein
VKTRLAASIGDDRALQIYNKLLNHALITALGVNCARSVFCDEKPALGKEWSEDDFFITSQRGTDLGERMSNAFKEVYEEGANSMIIIGSDCPGITPELINDAFYQLNNFDIVIGPALDGGYYLLGMNRPILQLFESITWSTSTVFDETMITASQLELSIYQLPVLSDIDLPSDLDHYPGILD